MKGAPVYPLVAFLLGFLITAMNGINSTLGLRAGNPASLLAVHASGLVLVGLVLLRRREKGSGDRLPAYYFAAGVLGVATVLAGNICFARVGASLTVAAALVGQMLGALLMDSFGLLGMKRRPFASVKLVAPLIALAGTAVMVTDWGRASSILALAFVMGLLPVLSFALNSRLSTSIGQFHATGVNYLTGLLSSVLLLPLLGLSPALVLERLAGTPILLLIGGGCLGVVVVAGMNKIFPRIPATASVLLLFAGQVVAALIFDLFITGSLGLRRLLGAGLLTLALLERLLRDRSDSLREAQRVRAGLGAERTQ
ncbi:MAG TPA: DMT family transporter [Rectinemataceae bacterium]|nr:DMT family transporter [Rectinemataceae bacterium]